MLISKRLLADLTDRQQLNAFISIADLPVIVSREKGGENNGKIVKNKLVNGLEINLDCVIITFNRGFSVFNVCCGPRPILRPFASRRALITTSGRNKRQTPGTPDWILYSWQQKSPANSESASYTERFPFKVAGVCYCICAIYSELFYFGVSKL